MNHRGLLFIAIVLLLPLPSQAWDSEAHTAMTQLTRTILNLPGFWEANHALMLADDAPARCNKSTRKKNLAQAPQRSMFDELVCGADDPDSERWPWENDAHQNKAEQFAVDEFNNAVRANGTFSKRGAVAYAEAANHLGRSLHFIQDLTDFSKDMKGSAANTVRKKTKAQAQALVSQWKETKKYPPGLVSRLKRMRDELTEPAPRTPGELVYNAKAQRKEAAADIMRFLNDRNEAGSHDSKLDEAVTAVIGGTIVIQEYWVELYLRYIGVKQ